jgi:hypothetical protein
MLICDLRIYHWKALLKIIFEVMRVDLLPGTDLKEKKYILNIELNAVIPYLTSYVNIEILSSRLS